MHREQVIPGEVVLDVNRQHVQGTQARFVKNLDYHGKDGGGAGAISPLVANEIYDPGFTLPDPGTGVNLKVGDYTCDKTNHTYVLVYNPLNQHVLYRIIDGKCQNVFVGPELNLIPDPLHFVGEGRMYVVVLKLGDITRTFVVYTDGANDLRHICVEDSIATNSFDPVLFPYFAGDYDRFELINLGLPTPNECIGITPIATDSTKINGLRKKFWQFRIKTIDVYNRPSEHGIISEPYYQGDCHSGNIGCLDLTFYGGNPLVNKFQIEYNNDQSQTWHIYKTVDKYASNRVDYWNRAINKKDFQGYDAAKNIFTFRFCATGECVPVPEVESSRNENPMPITAESLYPLAGGIGTSNNKYNRGPLDSTLLDQISFSVEKPEPTASGIATTRNIEIWVPITNPRGATGLPIWNFNGNTVFGGLFNGAREDAVASDYAQVFPTGQTGFIGYLAGTKYAAISEQYQYINDAGNISYKKYGVADNENVAKSNKWIQKFTFKNVPPGNFVFRIAGHGSQLTDSNYQQTSTYVIGTSQLQPGSNQPAAMDNSIERFRNRELLINVCAGDYNSFKENIFLNIWDLTDNSDKRSIVTDILFPVINLFPEEKPRVVQGYCYEDRDLSTGNGIIPMEGCAVTISTDCTNSHTFTTDHNGFYFLSCNQNNYIYNVFAHRLCSQQQFEVAQHASFKGVTTHNHIAIDTWPTFVNEKCNREIITGKIIDCVTGATVPNAVVGMTRGQFTATDRDGAYSLIAHDFNGDRTETIIVMSSGACRITSCDDKVCLPTMTYNQIPCTVCTDRIINNADYQVKITGIEQKGLQLGGHYGFCVTGHDWMDRGQFAQVKPQFYLDIPTVNEMGSFTYPKVKWSIPASGYPLWMKKLHFRITKNLAYNNFLSWVVDKVELIDITGQENTVTPTQMRIRYNSLNEYNKQNNFSTNTGWQVLDETQVLETKDIVQFVANGDGKIFSKTITEQIRLDKAGEYFLIDYNADLKDLQEGALIKLMRPGTCQSEEIFYELCKTVDITNGVPSETSGYLNAFDSFYVSRQIPTPIVTTTEVQQMVPNSNPATYTKVEQITTTNVIKPYSWFYEHHSPSDLWGNHCANHGRPVVKNPLERVIYKETEFALSGVLGVDGLVNYLHYFSEERKHIAEDQGWGGIIATIVQPGYLINVCLADWFVVPYDDSNIVLSSDGRAVVKAGDHQFGSPLNKQGIPFGCLPQDRNTITYCNGSLMWFDRRRASMVSTNHAANSYGQNLHSAKAVSDDRYYQYLRNKIKGFIESDDQRYFIAKYSHKDTQVYLTDFNLSNPEYVNTRTGIDYSKNDTIAIDVKTGSLRKFTSFTAEGYASLRGDEKDEQFFSFKNGIPYSHHKLNPTVFNQFFGVPVPWAWRPVISVDPLSPKQYLSLEVFCKDVVCHVPEVITESGQKSLIPRNWFQRGERYWVAPFLCDLNTIKDSNLVKETGVNALFDGDNLRGRWMEFLMVADPDNLTKYFELTGAVVNMNGVEKQPAK